MKTKDLSLLNIFLIFLKISSFTFGGGYTIIPVIKDEFSTKRNLISEEDMLEIVALGQSGPGAMAVNTSILTGYKIRGFWGACAATLGAALPCIVIISIISYFYRAFSENTLIQTILKAMSGAISAVLLLTSYDLFKQAIKSSRLYPFIAMTFAFIASVYLGIPTAFIILTLALAGLIIYSIKKEELI